jgi:hypothetical protein
MRRLQPLVLLSAGALTLALGRSAPAADPKFEFKPVEQVNKVEWKVSAQAGLVLNTGNANTLAFSAAGFASRNDGKNRLTLDVGGTYARATVVSATDANMDGSISADEIQRTESTTAELWNVKLRYDRFLSTNNSLYVTAFAGGNTPAGKEVLAGGQVGYARQLFKNDVHLLSAELGLDYSYENLVVQTPDLHIASLRAFVGYGVTLSKDTLVAMDIEVLCNLNPLDNVGAGRSASSFEDTRVNGRASLTTRLYKALSFRLAFTARFDNVPAPLGKIGPLPFAPGFQPVAEKLDTITDASLVVSFL